MPLRARLVELTLSGWDEMLTVPGGTRDDPSASSPPAAGLLAEPRHAAPPRTAIQGGLRSREVCPAGAEGDLSAAEVVDLDHAPSDAHEGAVAAVGGEPVGAADGRRRVSAACPELALAVRPRAGGRSSSARPGAARLALRADAEVAAGQAELDDRLASGRCRGGARRLPGCRRRR